MLWVVPARTACEDKKKRGIPRPNTCQDGYNSKNEGCGGLEDFYVFLLSFKSFAVYRDTFRELLPSGGLLMRSFAARLAIFVRSRKEAVG